MEKIGKILIGGGIWPRELPDGSYEFSQSSGYAKHGKQTYVVTTRQLEALGPDEYIVVVSERQNSRASPALKRSSASTLFIDDYGIGVALFVFLAREGDFFDIMVPGFHDHGRFYKCYRVVQGELHFDTFSDKAYETMISSAKPRSGIINLTQHLATPEQVQASVFEPENKGKVQELLTFEELPSLEEIRKRAERLAEIAYQSNAEKAMVGGAPYLMSALELELKGKGIKPVYAFSKREVIEEKLPDGSVRKQAIFRHVGFVSV